MKTYDPSLVSVLAGSSIIKNWNKVVVEQDEDDFNMVSGTQGEVTRTKNLSRLGTITLTLPQASEDNLTLSALEAAGGISSFLVKDASGFSLHMMPEGCIMKPAAAEYGKEEADREWVIKGKLSTPQIVGGN